MKQIILSVLLMTVVTGCGAAPSYRTPVLHPSQVDVRGSMAQRGVKCFAALWDNRQSPKVHQAFSEIWGTEKLWVSVDRACMKLPVREDNPDYNYKGFVHWDVDTANHPVPFGVQGVFYLTDFLVRHFDRVMIQGLGLDKHPELRDLYFSNYKRLVYLAQERSETLSQLARQQADILGLAYEEHYTGLEPVESIVKEQVIQWRN